MTPERPVFVPEDGLILWQGREIRFSQQQAQLLGLLAQRRPHFLSRQRIAAVIPYDNITVVLCRIRKILDGVPVEIESRRGYGYRLASEIEIAPE